MRTYVSVHLCVGFVRHGFLPVERPSAVLVGAGSQLTVLQEEAPRVCKVCGAALPPRCQRLLLTHGAATFATMEQLALRCVFILVHCVFFSTFSFLRMCGSVSAGEEGDRV